MTAIEELFEDLDILLEGGQPEKVLTRTRRLLDLQGKWLSENGLRSEEAEIRAFRGWAHLKLGNPEDAFVCFNTALGLDPTNERATLGLKPL